MSIMDLCESGNTLITTWHLNKYVVELDVFLNLLKIMGFGINSTCKASCRQIRNSVFGIWIFFISILNEERPLNGCDLKWSKPRV